MNSFSERSRRRRVLLVATLVCALPSLVSVAFAGQAQEGSIIGRVTDESGAVLPGVTVSVSGPALQVNQMVDVTSSTGEYRVTPLPLGTYNVEYTLSGFNTTRREGVRLTAGFVAKIDVELKVGAVLESVTVSGQTPVVDVKTTSAGTQITRELLEAVPTGRQGLNSLLTLAAGVRGNLDYGQTTNEEPIFRAFGRKNNSWQMIDGVPVSSGFTQLSGLSIAFNYDAFEDATVQTLGSSAESPTSGIQLAIVTKSGSNDFHGDALVSQFGQWMQSSNLDDALRAQGVTSTTRVFERWDRGGTIAGRIVRNKLWFFGSGRVRKDASAVQSLFTPDGSPALNTQTQQFLGTKLTYQMNPSNRIIGSDQWEHREAVGGNDISALTDWESRGGRPNYITTGKIEWQFSRSNKFLSLQTGYWHVDAGPYPGYTNKPATTDQVTSRITGLDVSAGNVNDYNRYHTKGTLNWYKPGLLFGNHDFKVGADYGVTHLDVGTVDRGVAGNYQLIFRSGVPFQINIKNNPVTPVSRLQYLGTFVQDSWTVGRRLTLNLGIRYAHDHGVLPEQCRVDAPAPFSSLFPAQCFQEVQFKSWNPVTPRLHASYDVAGDGKTVIKGGWGRFYNMRGQDELNLANSNASLSANFRWTDLNNNKLWEPGESNLSRNGPDFVSSTSAQTGSLAGLVFSPDQREPGSDEFTLSLERQLMPNLGVRVTGIYSRNFNTLRLLDTSKPYGVYNIPITNPDPGPDGRVGTADDTGKFITYYDYPASLAGAKFQTPTLINDSNSDANYKSFEVAVSKRLSKWQVMASYSATKTHVPFVPDITGDAKGVWATSVTPNAEIFAADETWERQARIAGSYALPFDIQGSASFIYQTGEPWARTATFTGGQQIRSITLRVEPIGTQRTASVHLMTLRAEKSFRLMAKNKVSVQVQVYNVLNENYVSTRTSNGAPVVALTTLSGPNYAKPLAIAYPRVAEFNFRYSF